MRSLKTPTGRVFNSEDLVLIHELHTAGFITWEKKPVIFKSKLTSRVYVRGRDDLTDRPELLRMIGKKIADLALRIALEEQGGKLPLIPCLIGIPVAGSTLAEAASVSEKARVGKHALYLPFRSFRVKRKKHGMHRKWIDGSPDFKHHMYMTVENVVTRGTSIIQSAPRIKADGYPVKEMHHIIFIDRDQGGMECLREKGLINLHAIYALPDILYAFGKLNLWPKNQVKNALQDLRKIH